MISDEQKLEEEKQHIREKKKRIRLKVKKGLLSKEEGEVQLRELAVEPVVERETTKDTKKVKIDKRVNNGGYMQTKTGWGRDAEGNLVLPEGKKIPLCRGWHRGLSAVEKSQLEEHNRKIDVDEQRIAFEDQNKKAAKFTLSQRAANAARRISLQLINEIEATPLEPMHFGDRISIEKRRAFIAGVQDTIKYHKSLVDHKELIIEEDGDKGVAVNDGADVVTDIRKKMNELKKGNDKQ